MFLKIFNWDKTGLSMEERCMKYLEPIKAENLICNYDVVVGWGTGALEFETRYNPMLYRIDYMVNGENIDVGSVICGIKVYSKDDLKNLPIKNRKVLVVIFANMENVIQQQIKEYIPGADTIVSRLIRCHNISNVKENYSSDCEDIIFMDIINRMGWNNNIPYIDIGVCHPVVRNNTYMFYSHGNTNGIMVEPNPVMCELIREYRPHNKVINVGATGSECGFLEYVSWSRLPGHNHFRRKDEVVDTQKYEISKIFVENINDILKNIDDCPYFMDIDTEGMDYELLGALDTNKFPVKVICAEKNGLKDDMYLSHNEDIMRLMSQKGYTHYMSTIENMIFVLNDEFKTLKI